MKKILLTLDLSTTSTGYAVFEYDSSGFELKKHGVVKPKVPGIHKMQYPEAAYHRILDVSNQVKDLVAEHDPNVLVVEEINRGINRIGQKSLDALHFFVLDRLLLINQDWLKKVKYVDSNGTKGWRGKLGLKLSDEDKAQNKEIRNYNKRKSTKLKKAVIDWKVLAQRYVNEKFGTTFDVVANSEDADICDAIAIGCAHLKA